MYNSQTVLSIPRLLSPGSWNPFSGVLAGAVAARLHLELEASTCRGRLLTQQDGRSLDLMIVDLLPQP